MGRKGMIAAAYACTALLAAAACGGGSAPGSLTLMSGGGVYQDALDAAFARPFEQETGVVVHDDPTLNYAKIKTMVEAGSANVDVIPAEGYWAAQNCGTLLEPIDRTVVDLSGIDPELIESECSAPLLTYTSTIYYNNTRFPEGTGPTGCADFFDVARFPGKRAASSSAMPNPLVECALIADGVPREQLYPLDVDRAFRKIETIKPDLVFWNSGSESSQFMLAGEVDMILAWNGRAYAAIEEQNAAFSPAYGEAFLHYDTMVVPKGVADPAAAMRFVAFTMDPARQAKLTTLIPYEPSKPGAPLVDLPPGLQEFLPSTNPKVAEGVIVQNQRWWAENGEQVTARWQQTFNG
ncbi:ABC transporter substrate-binding protein [Pseudonocardia zijingensis]|uniref:ABC transporter substrate-binding protein n=1 Tax=Pseudonocardia zijingensis TaxID=153376 RepID=A0ABN1N729_9PSEU